MEEILKVLGFSKPLVYAGAAFGLFDFLDKKASKEAKAAIFEWFQRIRYDKVAVSNALVEVFDRLYTKPLLGWRAFSRSILFTLIVSVIFAIEALNVCCLTWAAHYSQIWCQIIFRCLSCAGG
jgi:hypothetical protein